MKLKPSKPLRQKWVNKETKHRKDHALPRQPPRHPESRQVGLSPTPAYLCSTQDRTPPKTSRPNLSSRQQRAVGVVGGYFRFVRPLPETRIHLKCLALTNH